MLDGTRLRYAGRSEDAGEWDFDGNFGVLESLPVEKETEAMHTLMENADQLPTCISTFMREC